MEQVRETDPIRKRFPDISILEKRFGKDILELLISRYVSLGSSTSASSSLGYARVTTTGWLRAMGMTWLDIRKEAKRRGWAPEAQADGGWKGGAKVTETGS